MLGELPVSAIALQGTEPFQQLTPLIQRGGWRRVQPYQLIGLLHAPLRQLQCQRCEIGLQYFSIALRRQLLVLLGRPQPVADAGLQAPGPASALLGGGARHPSGLQCAHARQRIKRRLTRQAGIHHHANALDGQTGLGNGGRQHDFALTRRCRFDGTALSSEIQVAVQRREQHVLLLAQRLFQPRQYPADLGHARQKHQHAAAFLVQRAQHGLHHLGIIRAPQGCRCAIANIHRILTALAGNNRSVIQQTADALCIKRRRHDQQPQRRIIPQVLLGLYAERQTQIGIQAALVKFVEDHHADTRQLRVIL